MSKRVEFISVEYYSLVLDYKFKKIKFYLAVSIKSLKEINVIHLILTKL